MIKAKCYLLLVVTRVKRCRAGKYVFKQGRDDIIVKVNLQSLIPALFYTSLQTPELEMACIDNLVVVPSM